MRQPCVYILASARNGTLYVGVTTDLCSRIDEHKRHADPKSFTALYKVTTLVWFEDHETMETALLREKRLKDWKRSWKLVLIEEDNPQWRELDPETGAFLDELAP